MSKRQKITFDVFSADGKKKHISFFPIKKKLPAKRSMIITIKLSRDEINHIYPDHTFYDCCGEVETIMEKIQKELKRKLK